MYTVITYSNNICISYLIFDYLLAPKFLLEILLNYIARLNICLIEENIQRY